MKKINVLFLFGICGLFSCKNPSSPTDNAATTSKSIGFVPKKVAFICEDLGNDQQDVPRHRLLLQVDGTKTLVDTVIVCNEILKEAYKNSGIPANALAACGGWYAGGGDYFYAIEQAGKVVLFKGWQEEGQEDTSFHWTLFK